MALDTVNILVHQKRMNRGGKAVIRKQPFERSKHGLKPLRHTEQPSQPLGRSLTDFLPLNSGEKKLLDACRLGRIAVLGTTKPLPFPLIEESRLKGPLQKVERSREFITEEKFVRAGFIRFLLLGGDKQAPVHENGVQLAGAYISGDLNLDSCHVPFSTVLIHCYFSQEINAIDVKLGGLFVLNSSYLASGLIADRMSCSSSVMFRDVTAVGVVSLAGSQIGGEIAFEGASLINPEGYALSIMAAKVSNSVNLRNGFKALGQIQLLGAVIGGNFDCTDGNFNNSIEAAIAADGARVIGDVFFCNAFVAIGEVRLLGMQISGDFHCDGGNFSAHGGRAISADRIKIMGGLSLGGQFRSLGQIRLLGATIEGNLSCDGGCFLVNQGPALSAYRAHISGSIFLRGGFRSNGTLDFMGATIDGDFSCTNVQMKPMNGLALSFKSAVVRGIFSLTSLKQPACIEMTNADIGVLEDELSAWDLGTQLDGFCYGALGSTASTDGKARLEWLNKQPSKYLDYAEFRPQPWRQLQRVLRDMGHIDAAKQVGIALEDHLRKIGRKGRLPKSICDFPGSLKGLVTCTAHYIFGKLAGYGYRPVDLVLWMLGMWLFCGAAYWHLALHYSAVAPSDPLIFQSDLYKKCKPDQSEAPANWYLCDDLRSEYSTFSPLAYSLDVMLPVVDLGLEKTWGAYIPAAKKNWFEELFMHWSAGHVMRLITWFQILFGWISSLLLVAIISGFSRRNDEN